jgi:hypothetical protein
MIKNQTKCSYTSFNGSLVERLILENDVNTLWRLKVFLNRGITYNKLHIKNKLYIKNLRVTSELRIALMLDGIVDWERFACISDLEHTIETISKSELFDMFYNLDKNKYTYLGTPTANIIHNAIINKIIDKFDL